jgi:hypothetical protein
MRRQAIRDLIGTLIAFAIMCALTVGIILADFLLDATKAHKAGG